MEYTFNTLPLPATYGRHFAKTIPFDELYRGLQANVLAGLISVQKDGDLELFNYTKNCSYDKGWNNFTVIARGLILDVAKKEVVAISLPKFYNYGECGLILPNEHYEITNKLDGSCIILFFANNEWRTATRGSFKSDQAIWAKKWFDNHAKTYKDYLIPGFSYIFEVIYPENKIVINYDFEGLVHLTAYDNDGYEFSRNDMVELANKSGIKLVDSISYSSIESLLTAAETLDRHNEGFVVRFENGYRVKIKGKEYIRIHRILSQITPLAIWDLLRNCDDLYVIRKELDEEMLSDFEKIVNLLSVKYYLLLGELARLYEATKDKTDKETGILLQTGFFQSVSHGIPGFVFACRKHNFLNEVDKPGKLRTGFFNLLRPAANILPGFTPSTAMNRFAEEEN